MRTRNLKKFVGFNSFLLSLTILTVLALLSFIVLQWLQVPSGRFIDWCIGIASFWWLLIIVTIPWNIHFQAREIAVDAAKSKELGMTVQEQPVQYVTSWVKRSLILAISLHLFSAIGLYCLAFTGVSAVGYVSSGVALLLTVLRPVVRAYEYLTDRLNTIQQSLRYPREDVLTLRQNVKQLTVKVAQLERHTDPKNAQSWAAQEHTYAETIHKQLESVRMTLDDFQAANTMEHARLSREAQQAVAQLSEDGEVLNHVREIVRFFKSA